MIIILKNLNYKLINIFLIIVSIFFLSQSIHLYQDILITILNIIIPIILAFFISYSLYPCVRFFNLKLSYNLSAFLVILLGIITFFLIIFISIPILSKEIPLITKDISYFISQISFINSDMYAYFKSLLTIDNSMSIAIKSAGIVTDIIIVIVLTIYFLFNMEEIKKYLRKHKLLKQIDKDLFNYYKGFYLIILVEILEYLIIYFLIGHPYFLLIAILSGVTTMIPFIGALFTNLLALITAFSISPKLFILSAIVMILVPIFNNYVIEPKIYNKTLKISLISVIISCFAFGALFGLLGIIFAIPLYIIIKNLVIFFFPRLK